MNSDYQQKKMIKDSLDSQYKADEHGRVFDRPCQVLDDGNLDEH